MSMSSQFPLPTAQRTEARPAAPEDRSLAEERWNALTHGFGLALSLVGSFYLMWIVTRQGDPFRIVGCGLFSFSLVAVYAASTMSHVAQSFHWKRLYRILDQAFIYVLIVATYTPFSLAFLRTPAWFAFLALLWGLALVGFVSKLRAHRLYGVSVSLYVALGWLPIVSAPTLMALVPRAALGWMLLGGVFYTSGTLFLVNDRKSIYMHALWHLFVIAGSVTHFFAILIFVASPATAP